MTTKRDNTKHPIRSIETSEKKPVLQYFFAQFLGFELNVYSTTLSIEEFRREWVFHNDIDNDNPYFHYSENESIDVWESYSNLKLYRSAAEAIGEGMRWRRMHEQLSRLSACAQRCGKKRVLMRGGHYDLRNKAWRKRAGVAPGQPYDKKAYFDKLREHHRPLMPPNAKTLDVKLVEWAHRLTDRSYREEITRGEERSAHRDGVVVVFCHSDDLIELRGAIEDEYGAFNGGVFRFDKHGKMMDEEKVDEPSLTLRAEWCPADDKGLTWRISVDVPHATFDIMDDGMRFCQGVVFFKSCFSA